MKRKSIFIVFVLFPYLMLGAAVPKPGAVIFSDNFNTRETFAENWTVKGKTTHQGDHAFLSGSSLMMRRELPDAFQLSVTLKFKKIYNPEKAGMAFIKFGKFYSHVRLNGGCTISTPNASGKGWSNRGDSSFKLQMETPVSVSILCQKQDKNLQCSFFVDGKLGGSLCVPYEKGAKLEFSAYNCDVTVDDLLLCRPGSENASENLIINSSFEHLQEGMPLFYNTDTARKYNFKRPYEEYLASCVIDKTEKVSGKNSLKLVYNDSVGGQQGILTFNNGVLQKEPAVFSVFLKSDRDDFPVRLTVWEVYSKWHNKTVNVTKEWKRYEILIPSAQENLFRCGVAFNQPGTLWMDDLQLEQSTRASAYKISDLDAIKFSPDSDEIRAAPSIPVRKIIRKSGMDGLIDSWIGSAAKLSPFLVKMEKSKNLTEAYAAYDDETLYIAVRASVKDLSKVNAKATEYDNFGIFSQESIELMIDPGKTNREYFQLVGSAAGSRTDMGRGRNKDWNGNWTCTVRENREKSSLDYEFKLPFSIFAGSGINGDWGINIGRNDKETGEISSILPSKKIDFHLVKQYPVIQIPPAVLKKYAVDVSDAAVSTGGNSFDLLLRNNTGKARSVRLSISAKGKFLGSETIFMKEGAHRYIVPLKEIPGKNTQIECAISDEKNNELLKQSIFVKQNSVISATSRYSRYTPNDKNAVFRVETSLPNPEKLTAEIHCGKTVEKTSFSSDLTLPLKNIPEGTHRVEIRLFSGKKVLGQTTVPIIKMKLPAGAARINNFMKCLEVDGKNTFFFMPCLGTSGGGYKPGEYARQADWLADNGFKQCKFGILRKHDMRKVVEFLNRAKQHGIAVVLWHMTWNKDDAALVEKEVAELSAIGCIAAYKVMDEPELHMKSEDAKQAMLRMMKLIPAYPVYMNNTMLGIPNRYADYTTDILMLDDYLTNQENKTVIGSVMPPMDEIVKASRASRNQPCWFFLTGNNTHNHYREPTSHEQIAETWGCVVTGATGLSYFMGIPNWPGNWNAYKQLNKEILAMNDILLSEEKTENADVSDKNTRFMTRKHQGYLYVFIVNVDKVSSRVNVTLPADSRYSGKVEKVFENIKLPLSGNSFSEELPGESRHIYKIKLR